MSSYQERAGPNVSQYLNNLNALPAPFEQDFAADDFLVDDLAMFTNTNFTDYDMPPLPEEFISGADSLDGFEASPVDLHTSAPQPVYSTYTTPIQPAPAVRGLAPGSDFASATQSISATQTASSRRKPESSASPGLTADEKSRLAAEEDKRRRNTAASARFRVKKKQREQGLEQTVKAVNEKNAQLEAKVSQLELENQWLKNLITEKNGKESKEEIAAAYQKFRKESEERELTGTQQKQSSSTK